MHIDVEFVTNDGLSIHAHRRCHVCWVRLCATKSPVFRAMFESDEMKEPHAGAVHIRELSCDQLRYLLEFMYRAEIPADAMAEHNHALLIATDKYEIPVLGKVCEAYICVNSYYILRFVSSNWCIIANGEVHGGINWQNSPVYR